MTTAEDVERATMTTKREEWAANSGDDVVCEGRIMARARDAGTARRIAAVPDMEAALMCLLENDGECPTEQDCGDCRWCEARAALRKAGLL